MTLWAAWGGRKQGRRRKVLASVNVLCYVEDECTFVKDPPRFDGTTDAMSFMALFEEQGPATVPTPVPCHYSGSTDPLEHVGSCEMQWIAQAIPTPQQWVHQFMHTLEPLPRNWDRNEEMQQWTCCWSQLQERFCVTFQLCRETMHFGQMVRRTQSLPQTKHP
ncbi:hypothetical protein SUGI_1463480 [Cryptomeria japonica]|uniref:Uncharacterized protein n=1 Tax=Cryptomeria japonica TaxID=3369 RepID=A0AAD3NRM3_CRYJA|nr:hypothetical protein SUGI_1463480 [Cryptomeria japonica]